MDVTCAICLDLFTTRCDVSTSQCGHVFHARCITRWLQTAGKNKCPLCQSDYTRNIKLFFSKTEIKENYPKFNKYLAQKLENELKSYRSELEDFKFKTKQEFLAKKKKYEYRTLHMLLFSIVFVSLGLILFLGSLIYLDGQDYTFNRCSELFWLPKWVTRMFTK